MLTNEYKLLYPVYNYDRHEILPAGVILTEKILNGLKKSNKVVFDNRLMKLMDFGSLNKDIREFISQPPYDTIFSDTKKIEDILAVMGRVQMVYPVLESMEYFKEKDFYTYRHMLLVFAVSVLLSQELLNNSQDLTAGAMASPAHDFGKISIPMDILKKKTSLTESERRWIEHHTIAGYILLQYFMRDFGELPSRIARDHHERLNGKGYPQGIHLKNPLVEIVVVTDIYDALISPRPYRPESYDNRTALEEICAKAERGEIRWDVVKALISVNRKNRPHYSQCSISNEKRGVPPSHNVYGTTIPDSISGQS